MHESDRQQRQRQQTTDRQTTPLKMCKKSAQSLVLWFGLKRNVSVLEWKNNGKSGDDKNENSKTYIFHVRVSKWLIIVRQDSVADPVSINVVGRDSPQLPCDQYSGWVDWTRLVDDTHQLRRTQTITDKHWVGPTTPLRPTYTASWVKHIGK